jgi:adenylosuccinate synthase
VDKFDRTGIRVEDLTDPEVLREKLAENLERKNPVLTRIYGEKPLDLGELYDRALAWGKELAPYLGDAFAEVNRALDEGRGVLLEGAQGTLLDVDHGTYPFVTSSSPCAGGGCAGVGVGPTRIDRVIGVVKAYCTRVGEGPFPTEDTGDIGEALRERGGEYGATTGRPRRCGWLDLVALEYAVRVNGMDAMALTKLDVLTGFAQINLCVAYELDGHRVPEYPTSTAAVSRVRPVWKSLPGWSEDISGCRSPEDLPPAARAYVRAIEEATRIPAVLIGVGPARESTILQGL